MTIYFSGTEHEFFDVASGTTSGSLTANTFNSSNSRSSMTGTSANIFKCKWTPAVNGLWLHVVILISSSAPVNTVPFITFGNSGSANKDFRIIISAIDTLSLQYSTNGSTWTNTGCNFFYTNVLTTYDIFISRTTGCKVFTNNFNTVSVSTAFPTVNSTFDTIEFGSNGTVVANYSEIIVSNLPYFNTNVHSLYPNLAGTNSAWTGTFTAVADNPSIDITNSITSNVVGQKFTSNLFDVPASVATRQIDAVVSAMSGILETASVPVGGAFLERTGGVDYTQSLLGWATGSTIKYSYQVKPLDGASSPWSFTKLNALEIGVITT
jgi:hypothetical protein